MSSNNTQQQAAKEIAKATGEKFGDDTVGRILAKYDKDGNGTFDIAECVQPCAIFLLPPFCHHTLF